MNKEKLSIEKESFIEEIFGEKIDYCRIYNEHCITIVFCIDNKLIVKHFKNIKDLIEKYIEVYISNDFLERMELEEYEENDN